MRRLIPAVACAAAASLVLAACGTTESADTKHADTAARITLTDATGAKVTLKHPATRVVGTEWNVVEDLVSLGVAPAGVADVKGYRSWDTAAPLKNSPKDIGTRGEPSTDTIAALRPDLIVATTDLKPSVVKQLRRIAPVLEVRSARAADQIGQMKTDLDLIAKATGRTKQASAVVRRFETRLAADRKKLKDAGMAGTEVAMADSYVASNQVTIRPYTAGSLVGAVNGKLGLRNAWKVKGDKDYGLGSTDVEGLTGLGKDVRFAYVAGDGSDPFAHELAKNKVWTSLPFVKAGHVHHLHDGIWMFGGPASMGAYADALTDALVK